MSVYVIEEVDRDSYDVRIDGRRVQVGVELHEAIEHLRRHNGGRGTPYTLVEADGYRIRQRL